MPEPLPPVVFPSPSGTSTTTGDQPAGNNPSSGYGTFNLANPLDFLKILTEKSLWIRVTEVVVGGTLLLIGVNALLRNNAAYQATKSTGKTVAKTAAGAAVL